MGKIPSRKTLDKKIDEVITMLEKMNLRMYGDTLVNKWTFKFIIQQKDFLIGNKMKLRRK